MLRPRCYEGTEIQWDYDLGEEDARLTLEVEYFEREGLSPDSALFDPGEPAELELMAVTVTGALVGPDLREASQDELKAIQKELRRDREALGRIESYLEGIVL